MPLDAGTGPGILVGLERALGRHVGLQLSAHYGEADLSGAAGQYDLSMKYTSRPPPSYEPVEVSLRRSEAQPGAEGRLKTLAVALDLVAWADLGAHGRLGVAAGPAWLHTKGRAESLVYTAYHMGGHSTSFYQDYLVSFEFPAGHPRPRRRGIRRGGPRPPGGPAPGRALRAGDPSRTRR